MNNLNELTLNYDQTFHKEIKELLLNSERYLSFLNNLSEELPITNFNPRVNNGIRKKTFEIKDNQIIFSRNWDMDLYIDINKEIQNRIDNVFFSISKKEKPFNNIYQLIVDMYEEFKKEVYYFNKKERRLDRSKFINRKVA